MFPIRGAGGAPDDLVGSGCGDWFPNERRVIVELGGVESDIRGQSGRRCQSSKCSRVQARHGRGVFEIHELRQVPVFDAIFGANVLVLMVEVFPVLGKADGGESLLVKGVMVATPQVTVETENQQRLDSGIVGAADFGDVAREFAGTRIALAAQVTN